MGFDQAEVYYLKALDYYPHNLEEACEALNYAISYDEEHPGVLCLFGRIYTYQSRQYDLAIHYFERALLADPSYQETYRWYSDLLIRVQKFEKAMRLIKSSLELPGTDKAVMLHNLALVHEYRGSFKKAIKSLKKAERHTYNDGYVSFLKEEKKRVKQKREARKKKRKKKERKEQIQGVNPPPNSAP